MDFLKNHTCQLDGHCTLMELFDSDASTVTQPCKSDDLLCEYDMKRDLVVINRKAPHGLIKQSGTNGIWNQTQASPYTNCGRPQSRLSHRRQHALNEVRDNDIRQAVSAIAALPISTLPDSAFLKALGTPALQTVPPKSHRGVGKKHL